jgi:hypothetical protein
MATATSQELESVRRVSEQPNYDNYRYGFLTQINEASENFA